MSTVLTDTPSSDAVVSDSPPTQWTIADVHAHLPGFPDERILTYPPPGTATEEDLLQAESRTGYVCELIDGTLVRKTMATTESMLAALLIHFLHNYLEENNIGSLTGGDGLLRISLDRFACRTLPSFDGIDFQRPVRRNLRSMPPFRIWPLRSSPKATPGPKWTAS